MKIMTFNLRVHTLFDGRNAWSFRAAAVARVMNESEADMICTQEGTYAMLKTLASRLPHYTWIGQGRKGGHRDEHCAVFYRRSALQLLEHGDFGLSEHPEKLGYKSWDSKCPRMCTWLRIRDEEQQEWQVLNTHLDHYSSTAQEKGLDLIEARMAQMRIKNSCPAVLTGDFNCFPESTPVRNLEKKGWRNTYEALQGGTLKAGCTFHGYQGGTAGKPIDYIFVSSDIRVLETRVHRNRVGSRFPSDHYPVISVLQTR